MSEKTTTTTVLFIGDPHFMVTNIPEVEMIREEEVFQLDSEQMYSLENNKQILTFYAPGFFNQF